MSASTFSLNPRIIFYPRRTLQVDDEGEEAELRFRYAVSFSTQRAQRLIFILPPLSPVASRFFSLASQTIVFLSLQVQAPLSRRNPLNLACST